MANGSRCDLCPLRAQRRVGCDGPRDAGVILIGEAPGREEEEYAMQYREYGKPFVGRPGWALKARLLAPTSLCEVEEQQDGWLKPAKLNAFIMNVIMCRPPNNKINSPEGKKAVACCENSAKTLLRKLLEKPGNDAVELSTTDSKVLVPLGGTALKLLTGEETIAPFRGRVLQLQQDSLLATPEEDTLKIALRGVKPPPEFKVHETILKIITRHQAKWLAMTPEEKLAFTEKQLKLFLKPHLAVVSAVVKEARKLKRRKSSPDSSSVSESQVAAKPRGRGRTKRAKSLSEPAVDPQSE